MRHSRDVFTIGAAQRLDLELRAGSDDYYASGPGVWIMHDHTERATTNKGINPGGDITTIVYEGFMGEDGLPKVATSLDRFFDPEYYRGNVPVFDPAIFRTTRADYAYGWKEGDSSADEPSYPVREAPTGHARRAHALEAHRIVADSCAKPRGFRRIHVKGGIRFAREGEVYGFEPREIRAEPCEKVEIVLENTDSVRHAFMLPGLNPMFTLEFTGRATRVARFVTPDRDITLPFHCHVETHEKMGMHGRLVVGKGGAPPPPEPAAAEPKRLYEGIGIVVAVDPRKSRIVVDHEEIKDFMAPMVMGYSVSPVALLGDLSAGQKIRFVIDADKRAIVDIERLAE